MLMLALSHSLMFTFQLFAANLSLLSLYTVILKHGEVFSLVDCCI